MPKIVTAQTHYTRIFKQAIIIKSTAGRFINFTVNNRQWDVSIHTALYLAEDWLEKINDTISWLMLVDKRYTTATIRKMIDKGLALDEIGKPLPSNITPAPFAPLRSVTQKGGGYRQVTDIRQLEDSTSDYRMHYDSVSWGDTIATFTTKQGNCFTFASDCFTHGDPLVYIRNSINKLRGHNKLPSNKYDPIAKILISHKSCQKHYDIVKSHLINKPLAVHLNDFINRQPPFTPPQPLQGQQQANRGQNNGFQQQIGNARLAGTLFLLILCILCLPFAYAIAYTDDLSQRLNSDTPNRYNMAFFVSKNCLTSQSKQTHDTKHIIQPLQDNSTIITKISNVSINYDGETLQNTRAIRQICRAVSVKTESEPHHPINNLYSVVLTQNLTGGQI